MISYEDSLKILKEIATGQPPTENEEVDLLESVDRVLAEDVLATENYPSFDNSAMDGFAVNFAEGLKKVNSSDEWFRVQAILSAGEDHFSINEGFGVIEIMTGAPIPNAFFDTVVRIEDVEIKVDSAGQKWIRIISLPTEGSNVRRIGEDTRVGDVLVPQGQQISHEHLLALATQGIIRLWVKKRLSVGILSTGKELVHHETKGLRPAQIRNSTGVYLQSVLGGAALRVKNFGIVQDEPEAYIEQLKHIFAEDVDILISTGAVSMGIHDFVRRSLESFGAKIQFHKCAIRPGKPILFASVDHRSKTRFIFGLPGNPISSLVGFRFFIRPFLGFLLGMKVEEPCVAFLEGDIKKTEGFKYFLLGKLTVESGRKEVKSLAGQASFKVSPLINANSWIVLPEGGGCVKQGAAVEVFSL